MKIVPNDNPQGLKTITLELPSKTETLKATERIYLGDFLQKTGEGAARVEMKHATHIAIEGTGLGGNVECVVFNIEKGLQ